MVFPIHFPGALVSGFDLDAIHIAKLGQTRTLQIRLCFG